MLNTERTAAEPAALRRLAAAFLLNGLFPPLLARLGVAVPLGAVLSAASHQHLAKGIPISPALFHRVYSVRFSGRRGRRFLSLLCEAINRRMTTGAPPPTDEMRALLQQSGHRFSTRWLSDMETLALAGGLFALAGALRRANTEVLLARYARGGHVRGADAVKLYWCHADRGAWEAAAGVLPRCGRLYRKLCGQTLAGLDRLLRNRDKAGFSGKIAANNDEAFLSYVRGKSVAVAGPAPTPIEAGLLAACGVVAVVNYSGREALRPELQQHGADLSYYRMTGAAKRHWASLGHSGFVDDLAFYVYPGDDAPGGLSFWPQKNGRRALGFWPGPLFDGQPQMLQLMLLDLLHFPVGSLTVMGANFYLAETPYHGSYARYQQDVSRYIDYYGYAGHNLISQYQLVRALYTNGIVWADKAAAAVLDLGMDEYLRRMDKLGT